MTGRTRNFIVPQGEVSTDDQLRADKIRYLDLKFRTTEECILWLARMQLVCNSVRCKPCGIQMSLQRYSNIPDGFRWRCNGCKRCVSLRHSSFFAGSNLPMEKLLSVIYSWAMEYSQAQVMHECDVQGRNTVMDWYSYCRNVCEQFLVDNPISIGGLDEHCTPKVVEIEQSKLISRKCHRGVRREDPWMFGGVERGSNKCFLVEMPDKRKLTFAEAVKTYIQPGTLIVSNGWQTYGNISEIDNGLYEHHLFDPDRNHVDASDTNTVENLWIRAYKKTYRQIGTSVPRFTSHLHEFIWRNRFKDSNIFLEFIICLRKQYCVQNNT